MPLVQYLPTTHCEQVVFINATATFCPNVLSAREKYFQKYHFNSCSDCFLSLRESFPTPSQSHAFRPDKVNCEIFKTTLLQA